MATMRLRALAVGLLVLVACETSPSAGAVDWVEFIDDENRFRVSHPSGWIRAETNLSPFLESPEEVLSIGTFPLEAGGPNCAQVPTNALTDLGPEDVFVTLQGGVSKRDSQDRPVFGPGVGVGMANLEIPYCLADAERLEIRAMEWIPFSDAGRGFYLLVAIGRDANAETVEQLWMVANSLVIVP